MNEFKYMMSHNYRIPSFKRHDLVSVRYIVPEFSDNITEGTTKVEMSFHCYLLFSALYPIPHFPVSCFLPKSN